MKDLSVRIERIEISNFKNVKYGMLDLENKRKDYRASILGLYGQNGSGKTALINALALLKATLMGNPIPEGFGDFVNVDAEFAHLKYCFRIRDKKTGEDIHAVFEFSIRKELNLSDHNTESQITIPVKFKTTIFDEVLSYTCKSSNGSVKMMPIIDCRTEDVFVPKSKYSTLVGNDKKTKTKLLVDKKMVGMTSKSFAFSNQLLTVIRENCKEEYHLDIIESLVRFGNFQLFVITTTNTGLISMNALPLLFFFKEKDANSIGSLMFDLNNPMQIPQNMLDVVKKVVANMNIVLRQIVPGLTISIRELDNALDLNGNLLARIQFMSLKNSKEIPLKYESDGIKKIISILQLLIAMYNDDSITVAIDELDSGIFEYLLGEILRIISERGNGQLIFTSHNLRPLETIDKGFIAFTTTNSQQRYVRLANIKTNNNLRDFYYRDIVLGEQNENVYDPTNNYEIALAFREAGEIYD